ncbi:hypothetical protein Tsubulata_011111 [Turnera subulata]|uniref:Cytochrome P450 n=1 Tax=Turnera subulata TaxID=218843 RepID=A0A9Q0FIA0_9ROSI|nr:hypothetical protein Tsubulata_011111 [Turnera subulata]
MEQQLLGVIFSVPFILCLLLLSLLLLVYKFTGHGRINQLLPPSPPKLPVIGNLHQLGKLPHRSLRALSEKYGPLMLLHLGQAPTLVVSSADTAREVMKTHDTVFSNRPKTTAADIFFYGCVDVGFSPYGEYWRQAKKICVLELLSGKRVQSFHYVMEEEVKGLVDRIRCASLEGSSVNLSEMLVATSNNVISRCVLGRKADEEVGKSKYGELSRRLLQQFTDFSFGDILSSLGWMDYITGLVPKLKATSRAFDALLDKVIEEHNIRDKDDDERFAGNDFVHILLRHQKCDRLDIPLTRDNLKAILMDMFVGGTDTSSTTLEWAMAELLKNPNVARKVQEEVRSIVRKKPKVEPADIKQMYYLKCIIKETLRLHPAAPLLVPRETSSSVEIGRYRIPPKTRVLVNALAIQTDPKLWRNPEGFSPERFENNPTDYKCQEYHLIPFGGGRRMCPGITFGVTFMELLLANLLYWFDWKLANEEPGEDLDMTECFGLTVHKKVPLYVVPTLI